MTNEIRYFRWSATERVTLLAQLPVKLHACDVRQHLWDGLIHYIVHGLLPGGFLQAVFCKDLLETVRRADPADLLALPRLITFLEYYAPAECWGSHAKVLAWTLTPERLEIPEPPKDLLD